MIFKNPPPKKKLKTLQKNYKNFGIEIKCLALIYFESQAFKEAREEFKRV